MKICKFVLTQRLILTQYPGATVSCPNRSNPIADARSPAELDCTVTILRDGDRLSPEGFVVEAGLLASTVKAAGTNDRSCEDIARQICDRVTSLISARPAKDGVISVSVDLQNGPNIVSFEDHMDEPVVTARKAPRSKAKPSNGKRAVARKSTTASISSSHSSPYDPTPGYRNRWGWAQVPPFELLQR